MKLTKLACIALILTTSAAGAATAPVHAKEPVDYVDTNIGGIGQLLTATIPFVQYPYGMARVEPVTTPGIVDRYLADKLYGFSAGPATITASVGAAGTRAADYASDFDHDFETATPYYYSAELLTWNIKAEVTAAERAAMYRFTFPAGQQSHIAITVHGGGQIRTSGNNAVEGSQGFIDPIARSLGSSAETREYFYAEVSRPFTGSNAWKETAPTRAQATSRRGGGGGGGNGVTLDFVTHAGEAITIRVGISYISVEQAKQNLKEEIPGWDFETVKAKTRNVWNTTLGKISVEGGNDRQRRIFYTAIYHSLGRMTDITEDGRYFSGYDHAVHNADGHDFYVDDGLWDTFRSEHPLQLLLDAKRQQDIVESYTRMYQQSGWMPAFPGVSGERAVMIGHHADEVILDTYMKGYRNFDVNQAYAGMRKNATEASMIPWHRGPLTSIDKVYFDKGFFPALAVGEKESVPEVTGERRQASSVTLENSYDDWCVAEMAKALGKMDDYEYFLKLAHNYQNLYDARTGLMGAKSADGNWVSPFDPKLGGGQGGRDYFTEVNSWLYTFNVQHDTAGLINLMGGRDAFNAKLDQLFVEQYGESKFAFLGQFPDATGLVGQYAQGNEPSYHIPYLYDFSGQPWKTQRRVRQLMDVWYTDDTHGVPGDDDGGETSSWYVLSALGFYPVTPGNPVYEIGSPIFSRSTITLENGSKFTIIANHVSAQNKYIQSAQLNGKPLTRAWFEHAAIANGGTLVLEMGSRPNTKWGAAPQDAPRSMSHEQLNNTTQR